jgi:hypothetical protein
MHRNCLVGRLGKGDLIGFGLERRVLVIRVIVEGQVGKRLLELSPVIFFLGSLI